MQMTHNGDFVVGRDLVVEFDFIVPQVEVMAPKNLTTNKDINPLFSMVYQHPKVFLASDVDMEDLAYE